MNKNEPNILEIEALNEGKKIHLFKSAHPLLAAATAAAVEAAELLLALVKRREILLATPGLLMDLRARSRAA